MTLTKDGIWDGYDWLWLVLAFVGAVFLGVDLFITPLWRYGAWGFVILINVFIAVQLFLAASKTDTNALIPNRLPALFLLPLMLTGVLFAFSRIYIDTGDVRRPRVGAEDQALPGPGAALYFSLATLTTYGDEFTPRETAAKGAVAAELVTGLMLLIFAFPILVSRLAMLEDAVPQLPARRFVKINKDTGRVTKISETDNSRDEDTYLVELMISPDYKVSGDGQKPLEPPPPPDPPKTGQVKKGVQPEGQGV
jgi:hypothetical protein